MTNTGHAPYLGSGDPTHRRTDYYPEWLHKLADDVTLEAAAMDGFVQGADDVRSVVLAAKSLYEYQDFNYFGPCGDNGSSRITPLRFTATPAALSSSLAATPTAWSSTSW
jgi:hypothetical protein